MANYSGRGYARREEIARAKGYESYSAYRKAPKADREAATRDLAARSRDYAKTGAAKQAARVTPPKRRISLGGDRELVQTMNNRELYAFLKRADAAGLRVFGIIKDADGNTASLWKRGGIDPGFILDELRAADSRDVKGWLQNYIDAAGGNAGGVSGSLAGDIAGVSFSSGGQTEGMAA